ncbi:hypothetical protein BH23PLA1_BH23PLA1_24520 [soil metagenome]
MTRDISRRLARTERTINAADPKALASIRGRLGALGFRVFLHGGRNEQERGALELFVEVAGEDWRRRFLDLIGDRPAPKTTEGREWRADNLLDRAARLIIRRGRWDILELYEPPPRGQCFDEPRVEMGGTADV